MNISHPQQIALSVAFLLAFTACFERERSAPSENLSEIDSELTESAQENADDLSTDHTDPVAEVPESDPAPESEPDPRAWQRLAVRQSEPDVLREHSRLINDESSGQPAESDVFPAQGRGGTNTVDYLEPETEPACFFVRADRIAVVTIEGVVREYVPAARPDWNGLIFTVQAVFRLRVEQVLHGAPLPQIIYAHASTGNAVARAGQWSYQPNGWAYRRSGERGLARLQMVGADPIRVKAALVDRTMPFQWIPARVLQFAGFHPQLEAEKWDVSNSWLSDLIGNELTAQKLAAMIDTFPELSCHSTERSACTGCDTAEACEAYGTSARCACVQGMVGCRELPPEEADRCNLYPDAQ